MRSGTTSYYLGAGNKLPYYLGIEAGRKTSYILLVEKESINSLASQGPPSKKRIEYIREPLLSGERRDVIRMKRA
jgi:hypothetical protein